MRAPLAGTALTLALAAAASASASGPPDAATLVALQVTRTLRPAPALVAKVARMLDAAAEAAPEVRGIPPGLPWSPNKLLIVLEEGAEARALEPVSARVPVESVKPMRLGGIVVVTLAEALNTPRLAEEYAKLEAVKSAEPDGIIGLRASTRLQRTAEGWKLSYMKGSGDCMAGCIHKDFWDFRFDAEGNLLGGGKRAPGDRPTRTPTAGEMGLSLPGVPAPALPEAGPGISFPAPGRPGTSPRRR